MQVFLDLDTVPPSILWTSCPSVRWTSRWCTGWRAGWGVGLSELQRMRLVTSGAPWHSMWFLASPLKKYVKVHEPIPRRAPKLEKEPHDMPSEELLRTLHLSALERRRLRGDLSAPYSFLRWDSGLQSGQQSAAECNTFC